LIARLDALIAGLRADRERAAELARPKQIDPLVAELCGGGLQRLRAGLAEARAANAALAREVAGLRGGNARSSASTGTEGGSNAD
jgi:hypothetical protein